LGGKASAKRLKFDHILHRSILADSLNISDLPIILFLISLLSALPSPPQIPSLAASHHKQEIPFDINHVSEERSPSFNK
jgi:hypothetical protein